MQAPEAPPSTIKEKLLKAIQGGEKDPSVLGHLFGLNGHDLVKNLEQLRKEGFIAFKWGAGDRIIRVWIPKGAQNMRLLEGHTGEDHALRGDIQIRLGNAINRLPWGDRGFRTWSRVDVMRWTGLTSGQVAYGLDALRETGRLQQLGGGGRGKNLYGVRWRGERPPEAAEEARPVESSLGALETAPEPAQSLADRYPMVSMIIQLGKELEELTRGRTS